MSTAVSLLLVCFFLLMNAFFVVAEFAMVRVRKSQIDLAVEEGKSGAINAQKIAENVNAYLSACQLGITLASLALGWLGEPAVSALIHPFFDLFGLPDAVVSAIAIALGFIIITALHIVVGELIPKSLAIFSTERYALATATLLSAFYKITYPIMWLFNSITNGVMKLLGHDVTKEHEAYTDEELRRLIEESAESGYVDRDQSEYVSNIFDLGDKDAEAIMTPRTELICLDLEDSLEDNITTIRQYKYTRYPVMQGNKDIIVGFIHIKDLYSLPAGASMEDLNIRTMQVVPSSLSVAKLLQTLQENHTKITVVIDEHGGTAGIVTMSDVMDEIVGRFDDEYVHESQEIREIEPGRYRILGSLPIDDLYELMGFELPQTGFETAGGLIFDLFGRIPEEGDTTVAEHEGNKVFFTIEKMDGHRVHAIEMVIESAKDEPQVEGEETS
ncbi:MAG: hemolysin family protein [Raoultibacter sp.]|jgi:CBS domain containing-hemolysin-like protein